MNAFSAVAVFYKSGGMYMHVVLVIAIVVLAIAIERLIVIGKATAVDSRKLTDEIVSHVSRGDQPGARHLAMMSNTPVARVAQAMLTSDAQDEAALQSVADDSATLLLPDLTRRLSHLGMLANSATLIGLLGTITGLITAISGVGVADAAKRSAYLASGISEALHTTAFGLLVAIPTLLLQGWLISRVEGIGEQIDHVAIRLTKVLLRPGSSPAAARPAVLRATAPSPLRAVAPEPGTR